MKTTNKKVISIPVEFLKGDKVWYVSEEYGPSNECDSCEGDGHLYSKSGVKVIECNCQDHYLTRSFVVRSGKISCVRIAGDLFEKRHDPYYWVDGISRGFSSNELYVTKEEAEKALLKKRK